MDDGVWGVFDGRKTTLNNAKLARETTRKKFEYKYIIGEAQEFLVKRANELVSQVISNQSNVLVFLDRSARPASWIFEAFWSAKFPDTQIPPIIFICTGKKDLKKIDFEKAKEQFKYDLGSNAENLRGTRVLIVDDIEKSGEQKEFVIDLLNALYEPESIFYFEWNKLGGMRLPHGLSYEDDGSFSSKPDESKKEAVEQVKKEIQNLAKNHL